MKGVTMPTQICIPSTAASS